MAETFYIKQNDTSPSIQATLKDGNGDPVDLTGATVRFHMKDGEDTVKVDAAGSVVDASGGVAEYSWAAADTNTVGHFQAEFEVTYADTTIETFPNTGNIRVRVSDDIA